MIGRSALKGPLGLSLASLIVLALVVVWHIGPVFAAITQPFVPEDTATAKLQAKLDKHDDFMQDYRDRFDGRSFYTEPKPWPPPPVVRKQPTTTVTNDAPIEIAPTSYAGPLQPLFPVGSIVYFEHRTADDEITDPYILHIGEEFEGVTLVSINAPRTVRLGWKDEEFNVEFFKDFFDDEPFFRNNSPTSSGLIPGLRERSPSSLTGGADEDAEASAANEVVAQDSENEGEQADEDQAADEEEAAQEAARRRNAGGGNGGNSGNGGNGGNGANFQQLAPPQPESEEKNQRNNNDRDDEQSDEEQ